MSCDVFVLKAQIDLNLSPNVSNQEISQPVRASLQTYHDSRTSNLGQQVLGIAARSLSRQPVPHNPHDGFLPVPEDRRIGSVRIARILPERWRDKIDRWMDGFQILDR